MVGVVRTRLARSLGPRRVRDSSQLVAKLASSMQRHARMRGLACRMDELGALPCPFIDEKKDTEICACMQLISK
jgi:hypothetical protein